MTVNGHAEAESILSAKEALIGSAKASREAADLAASGLMTEHGELRSELLSEAADLAQVALALQGHANVVRGWRF